MNLIKQIDEIIESKSLLKHPFYKMWSDGTLSLPSLAGYSKEYYQIVKAVPSFMTPIIEKSPPSVINELIENQQEEFDHIKLWVKFARDLGISEFDLIQYNGLEKTRKAVSEISELMTTFEGGTSAMYAFEKEIPKISQTKLDGLATFYGVSNKSSTEYFRLHTEADIRHAATWRNILEKTSIDQETLIQIADKSITAQNLLLDSCYEAYC